MFYVKHFYSGIISSAWPLGEGAAKPGIECLEEA